MEIIKARNPHEGLPELLDRIERKGIVRSSRNGLVLMFSEPTTIVWEKPMERVVFWPERDANPFFHLMESIWMMGGRRDVRFVEQFVKRMRDFSDNGKNFHAAYGYRWRKNFQKDQLQRIVSALYNNKNCRRQVLGIWDVRKDLSKEGLDLPCNVSATFQVNHQDELDMVVHNRSNDAMMGAMGANVVHFSVLQEYVAHGIGLSVGKYWQVSSNMHVYVSDFEKYKGLAIHATDYHRTVSRDPYTNTVGLLPEVEITKVVDLPIEQWDQDLAMWMKDSKKIGLRSPFFLRTATPMFAAHRAHKKGDTKGAIEIVQSQMPDRSDWKKACAEWLQRRVK